MRRLLTRVSLLLGVFALACGSSSDATPDPVDLVDMGDAGPAPTYTELYETYFAPGTPGHCATAGCHAPPINVWSCGTNKSECYAGMVDAQQITPKDPTHSPIGDPTKSQSVWVNPNGGDMPFDAPNTPNPAGAAAIKAWVAAGAQDN